VEGREKKEKGRKGGGKSYLFTSEKRKRGERGEEGEGSPREREEGKKID